MTLQASSLVYFPEPLRMATNRNPAINALVIDADNEKVEFIFQAPKDGDIAKIGFRTSTVTTGDTVDVRLETVSPTTGDASGTLWSANTNASQVIADTDDNTSFTVTLTSNATVTKEQDIAVVIALPVTGSTGNMQISASDSVPHEVAYPYSGLYTTSWAKNERPPLCWIEYSDGSYAPIPYVLPYSDAGILSFNSSSTPDEYGLYFQVPFKCRVTGFTVFGSLRLADSTAKLYDSDGSTVLLSKSIDSDIMLQRSASPHNFFFSGTAVLNTGTNYRLTLTPTTTTSIELGYFDVAAAAIMDMFEGGQEFHLTSRTDAGAWSQTTTRRPFIGLIFDQLDDGAGGAGGLTTHPGMAGGMRG